MPLYHVEITIHDIVYGEDEDDAQDRAEDCADEIVRDYDTEAKIVTWPVEKLSTSDLGALPYGMEKGDERTCGEVLEGEMMERAAMGIIDPAPGQLSLAFQDDI